MKAKKQLTFFNQKSKLMTCFQYLYRMRLLPLLFLFSCQNSTPSDSTTDQVQEDPTEEFSSSPRSADPLAQADLEDDNAPQDQASTDTPEESPQERDVAPQQDRTPPPPPRREDPEPQAPAKQDDGNQELINELKELGDAEKQEMLQEKSAAEAAGARRLGLSVFQRGEDNEAAGDRDMRTKSQSSLLSAQRAYRDAKSDYRQATKEAEKMAALEGKAQKAQTAMESQKQRIQGSQQELNQSSKYKEAQNLESLARQQYARNEFDKAQNSFTQAKDLFSQVPDEVKRNRAASGAKQANPPATAKTTPQPQQRNPAADAQRAEAERKRLAERRIKILQNSYKTNLETNNMNGLISGKFISRQEQSGWSQFFKGVKDLSIKIEQNRFNIGKNRADVNFVVRMSYVNKSNGKQTENRFNRKWRLVEDNNNWRLQEASPGN